ncbi:PDZ and LIM domain protein Zasp [Gryllus bimaculatus]|nr:PDZ and LIM domain protein Zasp [Gryllus bimaculatus]
MAAQASTPKGQVLVNKQFNSPIKMYSAENVAEVLNKQTQVLENGAVGKKEEKTHTHTHVDKDEGMEMGRRERKEGKKKPRKGEGVGYSEEEFQGTIPGQPGQPQYPPPLQPYQYPSYQAPPAFEPPPSTVVLRAEAPISQAPFPVFESQPAAVRAAAPKMRGDEKWPPSEYKERAAVENQQRIALARGPAVRPRKVNRDYSKFFAQNALTPNYPSYKAPPGTQHYVEEGTSNF